MPKQPAKWTTSPREVVVRTESDGSFRAVVPLYDDGVKAVTFDVTITADRVLRFVALNEPGTAGLQGFQAWSKEA